MPNIKLSQTQASLIGLKLRERKESGLNQKGGAEQWWAEVEKRYRNEAPPDPGAGLVAFHVPFSQPRQDALTAQCCTVIGKQEPYMLATNVADTGAQDRLQRLVHVLWQAAGFELQIRKASTIAGNTNAAFYRLTPKKKGAGATGQALAGNISLRPGVQIDVMHGKDVVVFPAGLGGIEGCTYVGHRLYPRVKDVLDLQDIGVYFKNAKIQEGQSPDEHDDTGAAQHARTFLSDWGADLKESQTELWTGLAKMDLSDFGEGLPKGEKWYIATFADATQELLAIEEYPYSRPWYFHVFYIADELVFWSGRSVARNLYGLGSAYNNCHSMLYTAVARMAGPVVFGPRLDEKYTKWGFGDYIGSDNPIQPWSPQVRVQTDGLVKQIELFDQRGDEVARISRNAAGAQGGPNATATEQSIIAANVAVGLEEYIANFSSPLSPMAALTCEMVEMDFATIGMAYWRDVPQVDPQTGEQTLVKEPIATQQDLAEAAIWEPNGKSPAHTPQMKQQGAQLLAKMCENPTFGLKPYGIAGVILNTGPLSGTDGLQMTEEEYDAAQKAAAEQQQAELAAKEQPQQSLSQSLGLKAADLSEEQLAWVLEQDGMPANIANPKKAVNGASNTAAGPSGVVDVQGGAGAQVVPGASPLSQIQRMLQSRPPVVPGGPNVQPGGGAGP